MADQKELKRIFVGGLPDGISTKDLRMKFTPFGNVKDLEIITRKDDAGAPLKTFAFINIEISEKGAKNCLTTYNNCSWKGGMLKVQIAKEHFLDRLNKEKSTIKEAKSQTSVMLNSCVPEDIKSAVPGTLVPERRNWVIGKFGRALPVVFLRRKDGRKVVKYDPSKTVHCLKRVRCEDKIQSQSVENLTWSIESSVECDNGKHNSGVPKDRFKPRKRTSNGIYDNDYVKSPVNLSTTKNDLKNNNKQIKLSVHEIDVEKDMSISMLPASDENIDSLSNSDKLNNNVGFWSFDTPAPTKTMLPEIVVLDNEDAESSIGSNGSSLSPDTLCDEGLFSTVNDNLRNSTNNSKVNVPSTLIITKKETEKKEVSNNLRLESLKERTEVIQKQKEIVKTALQNIDGGQCNASNHLKLDQDEDHLRKPVQGKKITGTDALSWLGMDSSDDDDKEEAFDWKEHLDGRTGEKLIELQQKFGRDKRFKMDERFLENDEELPSMDQSNFIDNEGDEIDKQLKEEKQLSLNILQSFLGSKAISTTENEDSRNQYRDSLTTHYDPSREDHEKFEESLKKPMSPGFNISKSITSKTSETNEPVVTKSTFYNVSNSLKKMFEKTEGACGTFSFFADYPETETVANNIPITSSDEITDWKAPLKIAQPLPYDSSASESENEIEDLPDITSAEKPNPKRCLFYHMNDTEMMKKLKAESSSFMRKDSVETLKQYWVGVRQNLTQDYKKKRKDALRRQKKMVHRK